MYFKSGSGSSGKDNRVYNNTLYYNGQDSSIYPNAVTGFGDLDWRYGIGNHSSGCSARDNIIKNNIIYDSYSGDRSDKCTIYNTYTNNYWTTDGDPLFVNTDVSDPASLTLPDLSLQAGSGAIDNGIHLTQANGSGSNSNTLIVDDARYFQDGSWGSSLSDIQADWIAIGTVDNVVQISSINYSTNTITIASSMTWSGNANIWLYKNSSGAVVLHGTAPDQGAYEFGSSLAMSAPKNVELLPLPPP